MRIAPCSFYAERACFWRIRARFALFVDFWAGFQRFRAHLWWWRDHRFLQHMNNRTERNNSGYFRDWRSRPTKSSITMSQRGVMTSRGLEVARPTTKAPDARPALRPWIESSNTIEFSRVPPSLDKYGFSLQGKHKIRENMLILSQTTHFEHENGQNMLIPPKIRHAKIR